MYRLITKAAREEARKAWIGDKTTEKYKDIEYIAGEKERNGKIIYDLVLWIGTAGRPHCNYFYYSKEQRDREIESYKKIADDREQRKIEASQPKPEVVHNLKRGDIFVTSWGYDQTNYDYIAIIEIKGKFAVCQRTSALHMGTSGQSNVQQPIFMPFGDSFKMKIINGYGDDGTCLRGSYPFLCDGKIQDGRGGLRLDTFSKTGKFDQFHETMAEFGH